MASKLNRIGKDIMSAMKTATEQGTSAYDTTAEVRRIEGDTAWVHIAGGVDETPVKLTIAAKAGDTVQVRVGGGRAWITGNATAPPTDDRQANIATEKAETAGKEIVIVREIANIAKTIADTAKKIAGDTNQYFWHTESGTDTGAHITEKTQEEFLDDPANGGGNLLARSNGIAVRDGLTELATFGASGAQVGKSAGMHLNLDSDGMKVANGNTTITSINAEMYQGHTHTVIGLTGDTTSEDSGYNEAILVGDLSHTQGSTNDGALVVRSFDPNESEHVSTSIVQVTATKNQGYIQLFTDAGSEDTAYLWLRHINTTSEKYSEIQARVGSFTLQPQYDNEGSQTGTAFKIANGSNKNFTVDWSGNIVASGGLTLNRDEPVADWVTETGTDNSWNYKKWHSGKYEAWRYYQATALTITTASAGTYYGGERNIPFPSFHRSLDICTYGNAKSQSSGVFIYCTETNGSNLKIYYRAHASIADAVCGGFFYIHGTYTN